MISLLVIKKQLKIFGTAGVLWAAGGHAILRPAFALITNPALKGDLGSGNPENIFGRYLSSWWGVFFIAAAIAFILYLAWGALEWAISGSSEDRVSNAKNKIQNALVGLTILAVSWALVRLLGYVLGIDILETLQFDTSRLAP